MGFRSIISRIFGSSTARPAVEGQYREGPYYLPASGGWLPAGTPWNFFQTGQDVTRAGPTAMVEACISAYDQTIAMCPGDHWWLNTETEGRERQVSSAAARILRRPNNYQTSSDFMLNLVRSLFWEGNGIALALRNARGEPAGLHLMDPTQSKGLIADTGDIFYDLKGNPIIEKMFPGRLVVPQRDVLHVRLHTPKNPLKGEPPLMAAALDNAFANAAMAHNIAFLINQARPSFVLSTDQVLKVEQVRELREAWNEQTRGVNAGGTPILTAGLKPQPIGISSKDAELAEVLKLSDQHIALVYRVPLQILGMQGGSPLGSTEALMGLWLASGLGFAINHVELALDALFELRGQPYEYVELSTSVLLRSAFKDRVEAVTAGITGGLFSPNEGRAEFELPRTPFGDEPRMQQQQVPLSAAGQIPAAPPAAPPAPGPSDDTVDDVDEDADDETEDEEKSYDVAQLRRQVREAHRVATAGSA